MKHPEYRPATPKIINGEPEFQIEYKCALCKEFSNSEEFGLEHDMKANSFKYTCPKCKSTMTYFLDPIEIDDSKQLRFK